MSKQLFVDPVELRKPGKIVFEDIPVNQYNKTIEQEKKVLIAYKILQLPLIKQ